MMNELITIHTRFQHRRATAARWAEVNPILREGELGIELDTRRMKFGDGVTRWNSLEYCKKDIYCFQLEYVPIDNDEKTSLPFATGCQSASVSLSDL